MCYTPITIKRGTADQMTVGCGRCMACHYKYCNQWVFRLEAHAVHHPIFHCLTFTYNEKNLPKIYGKNYKGEFKTYMTLKRRHTQLYFKKLRNLHDKRYKGCVKPKISYLICGEYGDKFHRPHYHAIIFNAHPEDILNAWEYGAVYFGQNKLKETINYTLKYAMKSKLYRNMGDCPFERPFINVSKGLGEDLIVNKETGEMRVTKLPEVISSGKIKFVIPRYYQKKLNQEVDTTKFREMMIEKQRQMDNYLESQGITKQQWYKDYHSWLYNSRKEDRYNNEIKDINKFYEIAVNKSKINILPNQYFFAE